MSVKVQTNIQIFYHFFLNFIDGLVKSKVCCSHFSSLFLNFIDEFETRSCNFMHPQKELNFHKQHRITIKCQNSMILTKKNFLQSELWHEICPLTLQIINPLIVERLTIDVNYNAHEKLSKLKRKPQKLELMVACFILI